jgi:hypothetical protein
MRLRGSEEGNYSLGRLLEKKVVIVSEDIEGEVLVRLRGRGR